jgi:putative Mn2+ efflux pump MntP
MLKHRQHDESCTLNAKRSIFKVSLNISEVYLTGSVVSLNIAEISLSLSEVSLNILRVALTIAKVSLNTAEVQ